MTRNLDQDGIGTGKQGFSLFVPLLTTVQRESQMCIGKLMRMGEPSRGEISVPDDLVE